MHLVCARFRPHRRRAFANANPVPARVPTLTVISPRSSKEKAVNLVSEEEFRASAPADLSSVVDDPHQLQLNRLQYELLERERCVGPTAFF